MVTIEIKNIEDVKSYKFISTSSDKVNVENILKISEHVEGCLYIEALRLYKILYSVDSDFYKHEPDNLEDFNIYRNGDKKFAIFEFYVPDGYYGGSDHLEVDANLILQDDDKIIEQVKLEKIEREKLSIENKKRKQVQEIESKINQLNALQDEINLLKHNIELKENKNE